MALSEEYLRRFGGIARLYGTPALEVFQRSRVLVVGVGGVGSWVVEALARSGIGTIGMVDMDEVCVSNTNRQLPALLGNQGRSKIEVLAERMRLINPDIVIHTIEDWVTPDNAEELVLRGWDFIVDAIDSPKAKAALAAMAKKHDTPAIIIGGAGGQVDPTKIEIADLSRTWNDPLAAKTRSWLRRDYGFPRSAKNKFHIECVYSTEQLRYPDTQGGVCMAKPAEADAPVRLDCEGGFGASMPVTCAFAMVASGRVLVRLSENASSN